MNPWKIIGWLALGFIILVVMGVIAVGAAIEDMTDSIPTAKPPTQTQSPQPSTEDTELCPPGEKAPIWCEDYPEHTPEVTEDYGPGGSLSETRRMCKNNWETWCMQYNVYRDDPGVKD